MLQGYLKPRWIMLSAAVATSLLLSLVATQTTLADKNQVSDMNDRFATETTGANGFARIRITQVGGVVVDRVKAKNLLPEAEYQVVVAVQYGPPPFVRPSASGTADQVEYSDPVTTDKHGKFLFDDFDLGSLNGPGMYRLDVFVTHMDPGVGSGAGGTNISNAINRDPLLACQPTFIVTIE